MRIFGKLIRRRCGPAPVNKPAEQKQAPVEKPVPVKPATAKVSVISLLLPFGLDHIGPGNSYTDISLKKARIAADYYRGFKSALDSLTFYGYNYKLQLFDSKDDAATAHGLAYNPKVRTSDLIVGPIFPDDMKAFTDVLVGARKPIVSPLSLATFHNQNLVTVNHRLNTMPGALHNILQPYDLKRMLFYDRATARERLSRAI